MKKALFVYLFVLLLGGVIRADESYIELIDKADAAIAESNWDEAERCFERAISINPDDPSNPLLISNLGMIRFYAGKDSLALATLDHAISEAPASVTLLANRARILTATGHLSEAINDYNTIELLDSAYTAPYIYRGLIFMSIGALDEAGSDMARLRQLDDKSFDACIALAHYYTLTRQPEEAIPFYRILIETSPEAEFYAGRARCFLQKEALLDAADDIASGLELDSEYAELYVCRAILNKMRYRMDDALTDGNRAIQLGANREYVYDNLGLTQNN